MLHGKKIVVVMPAYSAEETFLQIYEEILREYVDEVILIDDFSDDSTTEIALSMGVQTIVNSKNRDYSGNQKNLLS